MIIVGDVVIKALKKISAILILVAIIPMLVVTPVLFDSQEDENTEPNWSISYEEVNLDGFYEMLNPYSDEIFFNSLVGKYTYEFAKINNLFYKQNVDIVINYFLDDYNELLTVEVIDSSNEITYKYNYQYFV